MTDFAIIKKDTKTIENIIVLEKENYAEFSKNFPDSYIIELEENDITSEDLYKQIENNYVFIENGKIRVLRRHLRDKTQEEIKELNNNIITEKLENLRTLRKEKLETLDYKYQTVDSNLENLTSGEVKKLKKEIELEKQRLRDLPETINFPDDLNELIKFKINV